MIYVRETMLKPAEVAELTLVLKPVAPEFVAAVDRDRKQRGEAPL